MNIIITSNLTDTQFSQINQLWNEEYPLKLKDRFRLLLESAINIHHYIIEGENSELVGWAVRFEKDNEVRFSIIIGKRHQGIGLGTRLLKYLKSDLDEFYGWVIDHNNDRKLNGEYYLSPLPFYVRNGFEILHDFRVDNDMLKAVKIKFKQANRLL